MQNIDFRNQEPSVVEKLLLSNNINIEKIKNFKKQFKNQYAAKINELKNIKNVDRFSKILPMDILKLENSVKDSNGNEKFVFRTSDNFFIESVLMPDKKNISICISTQAGCKFGCAICQTGKIGFKRNLFPHEILDQIRHIYIKKVLPERLACISFMGMGEPFDNLKNTMLAMEWISSEWGWLISRNKITFSTSGCVDFKDFLSYKKLPNLAVSLHSADENKRKRIMPCATISLSKLKKSMIDYVNITKNYISIEYCLIKNLNDSREDIEKLVHYLKEIPVKINLLNFNKINECDFSPVPDEKIIEITDILKKNKFSVIYRKSLGVDIKAGCGQLGESLLK
ncbi:MAG: radical SAM protein [Spirochaetes bacterium]|nr:radical SAM protein [Spirochaetota bacterium]